MYGILLDRVPLSAKNGWIDEQGRVYIICTIEEIMEDMNCGNKKAIQLLSDLEEKVGLIERKRQGLGKPNLIYVKNFISVDSPVEKHFLKCQNDTSGSVEITSLEVSKGHGNKTDTIIGNMDCQVFLGGSEPTTLKELSEALGKETIDTFNTSDTRGNSPSYGTNYQKLGKELMSRDELAVMDGSKCVLQLRGVRPFLSDKYDLTQHPNYKYTADYDKKLTFDIEKYLSTRAKLHPKDEFFVIEAEN